jgi:hypothetical protein
VFPARYELNSYIVFRKRLVSKRLMQVNLCSVHVRAQHCILRGFTHHVIPNFDSYIGISTAVLFLEEGKIFRYYVTHCLAIQII